MHCLRLTHRTLSATLLIGLASASRSSLAQGLPFNGTYNGTFTVTFTALDRVHDEGLGTSVDAPYGLTNFSTAFDATALDPSFENQAVSNGTFTLSGAGTDTLLGAFLGTFHLNTGTGAGTFALNGNFNGGTGAFAQATGLFTLNGTTQFTGPGVGILSANLVGQVTPEPSFLAFLATSGLTGAAFLRRRKQAKAAA